MSTYRLVINKPKIARSKIYKNMGISPLPRRAKYGNYIGQVIDEVKYQRDYEISDCLLLIQRIKWRDGSESIRFAYYTKPHGSSEDEWNYANRAPDMQPEVLRELIGRARNKPWFREVVE